MKNRATIAARSNSDRSPLYDVRNHASRCPGESVGLRNDVFADDVVTGLVDISGRLAEPKLAATSPPSPVGLRRDSLARFASEGWWSQTGSNRRPHACKARALPAELWPRNQKTNASRGGLNTKFCQPVFALWASPGTLRSTQSVAAPRGAEGEAWWAWEDLNFRPHAYQARALTN
jgi:hypothetical protein